jgi:glycine dehydrogenase subunit 1
VGTYIPHTDDEVESMLAFLGLSSVSQLFDVVPEALRLQRGLELATGAGEPDVLAAMEGFGDLNRARSDRLVCFAGGGAYDHEIPSVTRALAGRSEFVTSYTPYQPEVAQGVLQAIFEYQTMVARLAGLPVANASLYDGGSAAVEGVNLGVAASGRQGVWVSGGVHPHWRQMLATCAAGTGHRLRTIPLSDGVTDWPDMDDPDEEPPGVLLVGYPNYLGCIEDLARARACATDPARCSWWASTRWQPGSSNRQGSGGPTSWWGRARCSGPPSDSAVPTSGCSPVPRPTCGDYPGGWWERRSTSTGAGPT